VDILETSGEDVVMARKIYPPEYRAHLIALVRQGRTPESLAREFEARAPTIRAWVEAADAAERGAVPPDKDARIRELEQQVQQLQEEREILKKATAWFARESASKPKKGSRS
jgi:transposase